ncbi:MAG: DUF1573 domain-containing protein [Clostridium sp.]
MKDIIFDTFQNDVSTSLIRHKSILDVLTKYTESCSKVNRSVAKAITNCGCININASKQEFDNTDTSLDELSKSFSTHLNGKLCDNCREIIENQIGTSLFYLVSLCNILDINLYDVLINETSKLDTLGKFTFR